MLNFDVNWLAVLVCAVISIVLGMLWYGKALFGDLWIKLSKITPQQIKEGKQKGMTGPVIAGFIAAFVMSFITASFVALAGATTFSAGAAIGFYLWLGMLATSMLNSVLWEGKPFALYIINIAHYLVYLLLIGGILAIWV